MAKENFKLKYLEYEPYIEDIIFNLKERLKDAQSNKNANDATRIQDQIWTLRDYQAGCMRNINENLLKETFDSFQNSIKQTELNNNTTVVLDENAKKMKTLNKKRDQILKLIEKQSKGEKLEKNQIEKILHLAQVEKEIESLKAAMSI
ncbi:unnamed protein product [Brachionus calyciflorus]|uniref:Uncharacterized protein n=1 Tax=Brachionus calyciflorus TaxID=104777 RepID=A0A814AEZ0_9BILA|nr:unnamed protein product [Brachionus calyciflorus]